MITLDLKKDVGLQFQLDIKGTSKPIEEVRLVVTTFDGCKIVFPGTLTEGACSVDMAKAAKYLDGGTHNCVLEVLIDQNVFTPITETLDIQKLVEIKSNVLPVIETKSAVSATVSATLPIKEVYEPLKQRSAQESFPVPPVKIEEKAQRPVTKGKTISKLSGLTALLGN